MIFGAVEAGGTKFVAAIGDENGNIIEKTVFPTATPEKTMAELFAFFDDKAVKAIGLGCFGPIDLDIHSPTYGYITTTPKPGWANFNIVGSLKARYPEVNINFDTDVNAAVLGETVFGSSKKLKNILYLTIGTGIGGGAIIDGKLVHGLLHPEMGHIMLNTRDDDNYKGICTYHRTCFEGLASGPAIEERWGIKGADIPSNHIAWELEAWYIAQALADFIFVLSPQKIILGGGVMNQERLLPMIRKYTRERIAGYIQKDEILTNKIENYIIGPSLGSNAGICGALVLAKAAAELE